MHMGFSFDSLSIIFRRMIFVLPEGYNRLPTDNITVFNEFKYFILKRPSFIMYFFRFCKNTPSNPFRLAKMMCLAQMALVDHVFQ